MSVEFDLKLEDHMAASMNARDTEAGAYRMHASCMHVTAQDSNGHSMKTPSPKTGSETPPVQVTMLGLALYPPGATFGPRTTKDYEFVCTDESTPPDMATTTRVALAGLSMPSAFMAGI